MDSDPDLLVFVDDVEVPVSPLDVIGGCESSFGGGCDSDERATSESSGAPAGLPLSVVAVSFK